MLASIRDSNAIVDNQELKAAADWLNTLNSIAIYAVGTAVPVALFLQMNLINMGKAASFIDRSYPAAMPLLADSQKNRHHRRSQRTGIGGYDAGPVAGKAAGR